MKTITLEQACNLIEKSSALIINNDVNPVIYPSLWNNSDEDDEFMYLQYEYEFCEYNLQFKASDNKEVKVSGSSLFLIDKDAKNENDYTQITLLFPMNFE